MIDPEEPADVPTGGDGGAGAPVLVHLAGSRRGAVEVLTGGTALIGTATGATIHFVRDREPDVAGYHAEIHPRGRSLELRSLGASSVRVNGQRVDASVLAPGDVIQLGDDGPVLRFRTRAGEPSRHKSPAEALSDCLANARRRGDGPLARCGAFLRGMPGEIGRMRPLLRRGIVAILVLLVAAVIGLGYRSVVLEQRLERKAQRLKAVSELLDETRSQTADGAAVAALRDRLSRALQRVERLETRAGPASDIIARASGSVVFVQGAYGFVDEDSGERLRLALGPRGEPAKTPAGRPRVRLGGSGPPLQKSYTGTAFVAAEGGLLLTSRHIALPWQFDDAAGRIAQEGLQPRRSRLLGYLPGRPEPFRVELADVSERADIAVLRAPAIAGAVEPLPLAPVPPSPGEEVILLGYPMGIPALVARADSRLLDRLEQDEELKFWRVARRLSAAGAIEPLATAGIVGQITEERVVYDAGTTGGGSGGPLLDREGNVAAINMGVVRRFQGSNLGVPADIARRLLERVRNGS